MSHVSKQEEKRLIRRYLIWCYKTTKENLDKIDRKFTQLIVDRYVLDDLESKKNKHLRKLEIRDREHQINLFKKYINAKELRAANEKYKDAKSEKIDPSYVYRKARLEAIEKAIRYFLGAKELKKIQCAYEEEMTRRILEAREHT